jgi:hypothetical protein
MLDSLVGRLSFDPLAFAQQDERTQLASLLELVDLPFDPDELAGQRAGLYERRTEVGRDGKQLEGSWPGCRSRPRTCRPRRSRRRAARRAPRRRVTPCAGPPAQRVRREATTDRAASSGLLEARTARVARDGRQTLADRAELLAARRARGRGARRGGPA